MAQKKKNKGGNNNSGLNSWEQQQYDLQRGIFEKAVDYADFNTAINAVYHMLELKPEKIALKDTLALLFYNSGQYPQALLVGEEVLANKPTQEQVLEIVASSEENMGMLKESLAHYEDLYALSQDVYHLYKISTLQFGLQRFGECSNNLDLIISTADSETKVNISTEQGSQNVPVTAAAYNLRGALALQINQPDAALQNFQQAVKLFPEFQLAQQNLQALKKSPSKGKGGQ